MELFDQKKSLRAFFKEQRAGILQKDRLLKSQQIREHLSTWLQQHSIDGLFVFCATKHEPDLRPLFFPLTNSIVVAPKISSKTLEMDFYEIKKNKYKKNKYNIDEPIIGKQTKPIYPTKQTLICIPSLAIDGRGFRLGYGGGYYDRYLARFPEVIKMGVAFDIAVSKELIPHGKHDIPMQCLITNLGLKNF